MCGCGVGVFKCFASMSRHKHLNGTRCANVCTVFAVYQSEVSVNKNFTETVGRGGGGAVTQAGLCGRVWVGLR